MNGDAVHRIPAVACILLGVTVVTQAQATLPLDTVLDRFRDYLTTYYQAYAATIAIEHYTQRTQFRTQRLESEFAMVRVPGREEWLGFRDVLRANGQAVTAGSGRLAELFRNPTARSFDMAAEIAQQSARFNIGEIRRTVNNPAVVLEVLAPRHHHRFRFSKDGEERVGNIQAWIVRIVEQARPTIVQSSQGDNEPIEGKLWIDPGNGALLRASIRLLVTGVPREWLHLDVTFAQEPTLQMWVPAHMREMHEVSVGYRYPQTGEATYTDYRQFAVRSRILEPGRD